MRQISSDGGRRLLLLLLLLLAVLSFHTPAVSSRLLRPAPNPGDSKTIRGLQPQARIFPEEGSWRLAGTEECEEGSIEECENRRMMYEAHLDYIYTQNHRKP